jgi:hypothetical protein
VFPRSRVARGLLARLGRWVRPGIRAAVAVPLEQWVLAAKSADIAHQVGVNPRPWSRVRPRVRAALACAVEPGVPASNTADVAHQSEVNVGTRRWVGPRIRAALAVPTIRGIPASGPADVADQRGIDASHECHVGACVPAAAARPLGVLDRPKTPARFALQHQALLRGASTPTTGAARPRAPHHRSFASGTSQRRLGEDAGEIPRPSVLIRRSSRPRERAQVQLEVRRS